MIQGVTCSLIIYLDEESIRVPFMVMCIISTSGYFVLAQDMD